MLELIEAHLTSPATAIADREGELSYRELDRRSAGLARALLEAGLRPDEPVVIHAHLSRWAVIGMLAVLRAGGRYVAIDAAFPVGRQQDVAQACGARIALIEPDMIVPLNGPSCRIGMTTLSGGPVPAGQARLAYTCYTSGSTGTPKPVTISRAALAWSTSARLTYYPSPVTGFLLCSSISFDSSVAGIYWTLASGGTLVIPSQRPSDLAAAARFAAQHRPSHLLMVPSLYGLALRNGLADAFGSLDTVIVAGETCPPALVGAHYAALPEAILHNEYGPTECTVWSTVHRCVPEDARSSRVPIGHPVPGARVSIAKPNADGVGELVISGPGLAEGVGDAYRTGDLVSRRGDGALLFHGRADHQLKLSGARVERAEIEHAMAAFPGVREAAVGVTRGLARLKGFLVTEQERIDRRALRAHLLDRLPVVAVPAVFERVDGLPRLPNGKVDYTALDDG
ncbi:amino acid adenylation domain-containing protein [Nonomuraea salmonea]|jgi:non-ribosomal peptide synthetase component F|uniref:Amino acid adenylation domain-containing protein n=1 Tax=Nonomuraea salmonea TaxID=46181 RepID=A0ABV5P116_9ACTN